MATQTKLIVVLRKLGLTNNNAVRQKEDPN